MKRTGKHRQSGNMILYLFGAIAVTGVLTTIVGNVVQGPLNLAATKHRTNTVESQLAVAAKAAAMAATKQPSNGDCDGDSFVEPVPYMDAGAAPKPTGGGLIPMTIGAARKDPWGVDFGYCVFDHGPKIADAACGGATQKRLDGTNQSKWDALAVVSAGPDGIFQTTCNAWVDTTPADNLPDTPMVNKPGGSDDIVFTWSFAEANVATGGLWTLKPSDPNTAEISMNLGVKDSGGTEQLSFDAATKALSLGTGGTASFPTAKADYLDALMGTQINFLNAIDLTGSYSVSGTEVIDEDGMIVHGEQDPKIGTITNGKWCTGIQAPGIYWSTVANGTFHSCGLKTNGTLWCWGWNNSGQLGDGTTSQRNNPTQVGTDTNWDKISNGNAHVCGSKSDGTLWCWGGNSSGQLGDGTTTQRNSPVQVGVGTNWAEVTNGYAHTCGQKTDGTVWCWGENGSGQLGIGNTTDSTTPVQVGVATNWTAINKGFNSTCGRKSDGTLWCWGENGSGQLGDGTITWRNSPVKVGTATDWVKFSTGRAHTCATKTNGTLWCWGWNVNGQLGIGSTTDSVTPVQVGAGTNWADVVAGQNTTCARKSDNTLWCWGDNTHGGVGDGTNTQRNSPVQVGTAANWTGMDTFGYTTVGTKNDGSLWGWGNNQYGGIGNGTTTPTYSPIDIGNTTPPGPATLECTSDGPGVSNIQTGVTGDAVLAASCAKLGELRKDSSGNLLVCDDNASSQIAVEGTCTGFEPGSLTFDKDGALYACAKISGCHVDPIGAVCTDGAIYIGDVGGNRIYARDLDSSTGAYFSTPFFTATPTSTTDGPANTNTLMALHGGADTYPPAAACRAHGAEWYLPASDELSLIWTNRVALNLASIGINTVDRYWSSTQPVGQNPAALSIRFDGAGSMSAFQKHTNLQRVRCVRR